jgi:hypothetical protein
MLHQTIMYLTKKLSENIKKLDIDYKNMEEGNFTDRTVLLNSYVKNLSKKEDTINILKTLLFDVFYLALNES